MSAKIDELWPQTHVAAAFLYAILCIITRTIRKLWRSYKDVLPIERLLYYRRYLFSCLELYVRYDRRVMEPNTHLNHFPIRHFVRNLYTRKSKTTGRKLTFSNRMTALLSAMSIFCIRAGCKIQMASYASKHALQSLFDKLFVRM